MTLRRPIFSTSPFFLSAIAAGALALLVLTACSGGETASDTAESEPAAPEVPADFDKALLVSLAVLDRDEDGPKPQPARLGILRREGGEWIYSTIEDPKSNVFHKAMAYGDQGILTLGGTEAVVELHRPDGTVEELWREDFGGRFSRMRDGEVADLDGDGDLDIAVATHDQGVVAVLRPEGDTWEIDRLDRQEDIIVHEIEIGDVNGDGTPEVYATPSEPNKLDGSHQAGWVVRYVPATGEGRTVVADMGDRHAKEILVTDIDGDGADELYVAVEAVSGGQVEIRKYGYHEGGPDAPASEGEVIATLDDQLTRFLTAGDVDGDGDQELVAAANKAGLWLLEPSSTPGVPWGATLIDGDSGGFEHASILTDLDGDGTDELYVASDDDDEISRYVYLGDGEWDKEVLVLHLDGLSRFTWNLMPAPVELLPAVRSTLESE